jgi:hypothetical protein
MGRDILWDDIEDPSVAGVDIKDAPDFSDAFILIAWWGDTGHVLSDEELEQLNNKYPDKVNQLAHEEAYGIRFRNFLRLTIDFT